MHVETFQINDARPYTANGERGLHVRTLLATVTRADGTAVAYTAEVVEEQGRPSFASASGVVSGEILPDAFARRLRSGEWQTITP